MASGTGQTVPPARAARRRVLVARCLLDAGAAAVVVGVLLALVVNVPGGGINEYQRTGERDDPYPWLGRLAIGMMLVSLAWWWSLRQLRERPWRTRLAVSVAMAAVAAGAFAIVAIQAPQSGAGGGLDLSFSLMLLAMAAVVLGAAAVAVADVAVAVGGLHQRSAEIALPARASRIGLASAVVVAVLIAAAAALAVPALTVRANTSATPASSGPPEAGAPVLDGTFAWSITGPGAGSRTVPPELQAFDAGAASVADVLRYSPRRIRLLSTAGGLAVLEARGVRVLDPADGVQRWSYHRWDARHFGPRHTRRSAEFGTAAVSSDGRWLAMTMFVDAQRSLLIDAFRAHTRVWLLDAVTGERVMDAPVPDTTRVVAVEDGRVAVTGAADETGDEGGDETGQQLAMLGRDGTAVWRQAFPDGCLSTQVVVLGSDLLALLDCGDRRILWRLDGGTGEPGWAWQVRELAADRADRRSASMVVAGSTAVVSLHSGASHRLMGIRVSDGAELWRRPVDSSDTSSSDNAHEVGHLRAAGGTVVLVELRGGVVLRGVNAATGEAVWIDEIPDAQAQGLVGRVGSRDALLPDGRFLLTYVDPADEDRCLLGVWKATTGQRHPPVVLRASGQQPACGALSVVLQEASGVVVAWQPDSHLRERGPWLVALR